MHQITRTTLQPRSSSSFDFTYKYKKNSFILLQKKENKNFLVLHNQIDYEVKYSRRHNSQVSNVTSKTEILPTVMYAKYIYI